MVVFHSSSYWELG